LTTFVPAVAYLCTDEQKARWLKKAQNLDIIGSYAQTEIGHGNSTLLH